MRPDKTCHRTPHEPTRELPGKRRRPVDDDDDPQQKRGIVFDVSQPHAIEQREIRTDDQVEIESGAA